MAVLDVYGKLAVSTHSRAEAAAGITENQGRITRVSTHSRAEAAAFYKLVNFTLQTVFQHTAARRRLQDLPRYCAMISPFQHTAARRRLLKQETALPDVKLVSTHSRAEAAAPYIKK